MSNNNKKTEGLWRAHALAAVILVQYSALTSDPALVQPWLQAKLQPWTVDTLDKSPARIVCIIPLKRENGGDLKLSRQETARRA